MWIILIFKVTIVFVLDYSDVKFIIIGYSGKSTDSEVHMYTTNEVDGYTQLLSHLPESAESQTTAETDTNIQQYQPTDSFRNIMGKMPTFYNYLTLTVGLKLKI